jgi:hypothetical protein
VIAWSYTNKEKLTMPQSKQSGAESANGFKFSPALLRTESQEEFESLFGELKRAVQPTDFVGLMYVHDIAVLTWDIMRHRRDKAGIINNAFRRALVNLVRPILVGSGNAAMVLETESAASKLADDWFYSQEARDRISSLLEEAGRDMQAVEAEALRIRLDDIERVDRLLTVAEARREKAFRFIAWYSEGFAKTLQQSSERMLAADPLLGNAYSELN